jgi:hypothetical protein
MKLKNTRTIISFIKIIIEESLIHWALLEIVIMGCKSFEVPAHGSVDISG